MDWSTGSDTLVAVAYSLTGWSSDNNLKLLTALTSFLVIAGASASPNDLKSQTSPATPSHSSLISDILRATADFAFRELVARAYTIRYSALIRICLSTLHLCLGPNQGKRRNAIQYALIPPTRLNKVNRCLLGSLFRCSRAKSSSSS